MRKKCRICVAVSPELLRVLHTRARSLTSLSPGTSGVPSELKISPLSMRSPIVSLSKLPTRCAVECGISLHPWSDGESSTHGLFSLRLRITCNNVFPKRCATVSPTNSLMGGPITRITSLPSASSPFFTASI